MVNPYPNIDERGVLTQIQDTFVEPLRRTYTANILFAGKETKTAHWGIETYEYRSFSEFADAVVSMDLPPVTFDSGTVSKSSVEIPAITKDVGFGGRAWRRLMETGLDTQAILEAGRAMGDEINRALLFGYGASNPGPTEGLLNATGITTIGGDWTTAANVNTSLSEGLKQMLVDRIRGGAWLVANPADSGKLLSFVGDSPSRMIDNLPLGIDRNILWEEDVTAGEAFLVAKEPGHYRAVSPGDGPFGLGTALAGLANAEQLIKDDTFMKERIVRFLNFIAPDVIHPEGVVKLTT